MTTIRNKTQVLTSGKEQELLAGTICKLRRKSEPTPREFRTFDKVLPCVFNKSSHASRRAGVSTSFTSLLLIEGAKLSTDSLVNSTRFSGKLTIVSFNSNSNGGKSAETKAPTLSNIVFGTHEKDAILF